MKRGIIYFVLMVAALVVPVRRVDVGKLIPVETLFLYAEGDRIVLETDTGQTGKGSTVQEAAVDLRKKAPGYLYLDTAEYLLMEPGMEGYLAQMNPYLKASTGVCTAAKGTDLSKAAEYLTVHQPERTIGEAVVEGRGEKECVSENMS